MGRPENQAQREKPTPASQQPLGCCREQASKMMPERNSSADETQTWFVSDGEQDEHFPLKTGGADRRDGGGLVDRVGHESPWSGWLRSCVFHWHLAGPRDAA